ncbi:hypothetical protein PBY51_011992 [Eleginops maclovinus]|uniref:Leptin n=1 Tax=Eleginops maclovinus TaxID=56733 RepID=A0AAN7XVA5_ELEMC|nr:hypothetical protein PBY51_011992 [Eleginops maclovinus]
MDNTLALLFSLLFIFSVGTAAPLPMDVVNMKSRVKVISETLLSRLKKGFQDPPGLTPADDLDGLSSTVYVLEGYRSLINDSVNGAKQVRTDISSLTGHLRLWMEEQCSEQQHKGVESQTLKLLQSRQGFTLSVSLEAVMRVKEFLNLLLKRLDNLESC